MGVDAEHLEPADRDLLVDPLSRPPRSQSHVAEPSQEAIGDTRGAAAAARDQVGGVLVDLDFEDLRGATHDLGQVLIAVGHEPLLDSEPVSKGLAQEPRASRGADQGEALQGEADGLSVGALVNRDVDPVVLHCGVEVFLDMSPEPVDLVYEEHVPAAELGQHAREVSWPLDHGPRGHDQSRAQDARHERRERRLAKAGGPRKQGVVEGALGGARCLEPGLEVVHDPGLTHEPVEGRGPQAAIAVLGTPDWRDRPSGGFRFHRAHSIATTDAGGLGMRQAVGEEGKKPLRGRLARVRGRAGVNPAPTRACCEVGSGALQGASYAL